MTEIQPDFAAIEQKRIQNMISAAKQMGYELTPIPVAA
jgi:hypothetical protein